MEPENVELCIAPVPRGGVFHPKLYRFFASQGTVCWIGSASFTGGGFGANAELVHLFRGGNDVGGEWCKHGRSARVTRANPWHVMRNGS